MLVSAAQTHNEMIFEGLDCTFSRISVMDVWWDQLEINILSCHKVLEGTGGFIVKVLEFGAESRGAKAVVGNLKRGKNGVGTSIFERNSYDAITVVVIHNEDVVVAGTRGCNKFSSEIHVSLSCGLHHGGKAQVGAGTVVNSCGEGIISWGWLNRSSFWETWRFSGTEVLSGLVKMAFDSSNGLWWMLL